MGNPLRVYLWVHQCQPAMKPIPMHVGTGFDGCGYGYGKKYPWVTRAHNYPCLWHGMLTSLTAISPAGSTASWGLCPQTPGYILIIVFIIIIIHLQLFSEMLSNMNKQTFCHFWRQKTFQLYLLQFSMDLAQTFFMSTPH